MSYTVKQTPRIWVRKASGEFELYNPKKILRSCMKAGASKEEAEKILEEVNKILYDGISTREIYTKVEEALRTIDYAKASKYRIKDALMQLGPAGFPFESFIAKILEYQGYETRLRTIVKGKCASHEIDVIADKGDSLRYMIECKYHNSQGIYTGLKEALYTHARFLDLNNGYKLGLCEKFDAAWLVTNTKFSLDAIGYAKCTSMNILGWSYPPDMSLQKLIEWKGLYPITILKKLTIEDKARLSKMDLVTLNDLIKRSLRELRRITGIPEKRLSTIKREAEEILGVSLTEC